MAAKGYPNSDKKGEKIELPQEPLDCKIFHAGTIENQGNILSNGGRVLCVTSLGYDIKDSQKKAYDLIKNVKWQTPYYRTDIGFKGVST